MNSLTVSQDFIRELQHAMPMELPNFTNRIRVTSDTDKYKWKEDESVWSQKRGLSALSYEVLFDGEFICFFDLNDDMGTAIKRALIGFREQFQRENLFVNPQMYEVIKAQREAKEKAELDNIPKPTSEAEELLAKVIKRKRRKKNATTNS